MNDPPALLRRILKRLSGHGLLAIADQAAVSAANFAAAILIGRWSGSQGLGLFTLVFTAVIAFAVAQQSIVLAPYTFLNRRLDEREQRSYLAGSLAQASFMALAGCLILAVASAVAWSLSAVPLGKAMLAGAFSLPLFLLREFARRYLFATLRFPRAFIMDACYSVLYIGGLILLGYSERLTAWSVFVVFGVANGVSSLPMLISIVRQSGSWRGTVREALARNWRFGGWILASELSASARGSMLHWALVVLHSSAATGLFAGCLTVMRVVNPVMLGLANITEPRLAKAFSDGGHRELARQVVRFVVLNAIYTFPLVVLVAVWGAEILTLVFGSEFHVPRAALALLAVSGFLSAVACPLVSGVRALGKPQLNFRIRLIGLLFSAFLAIASIPRYGVLGAAWTVAATSLLVAVLRVLLFRQLMREKRGSAPRPDDSVEATEREPSPARPATSGVTA